MKNQMGFFLEAGFKCLVVIIMLLAASVCFFNDSVLVGDNQYLTIIGWSVLFISLFVVFSYLGEYINKRSKKIEYVYVGIIIVLGLIVRLIVMISFKTEQVSDFAMAHKFYLHYQNLGEYTLGTAPDNFQLYYTRYSAWYLYMRICAVIYDIFGYNINYILILNLVLTLFAMVFLYLGVKKLYTNKQAFLALVLYAFCPSLILWTGVTTPDHFALLLFSIFIWSYAQIDFQANSGKEKRLMWIVTSVIVLILINFFKPLSILGLLALIFTAFIGNVRTGKRWKYCIKEFALIVILFLGGLSISQNVLSMSIENMMKYETVDGTYMYIYAGHHVNEDGVYTASSASNIVAEVFTKWGNDQEAAMEEFKEMAFKQFKEQKQQLLNIWKQKFVWIFYREHELIYWINTSTDEEHVKYINTKIVPTLREIMLGYSAMLYILSAISMGKDIFMKNKMYSKQRHVKVMLGMLMIGYIMILLLSGAQGRYKILLVPIWSFFASDGLSVVKNKFMFIEKNLGKVRK